MSEDNAYPEKWRQLEYVGERGTWSPDRTMSYACEERIKYDKLEKENEKIIKYNDELAERAGHLDNELQMLKRRHARKEEYTKKLEDENNELKKMIEDMQASFKSKQNELQEELDWFHKSLAEVEKQRDEAKHNYDFCSSMQEHCEAQIKHLETATDLLQSNNATLREALTVAVGLKDQVKEEKQKISRCLIQTLKENVDIRSVLREHLEEENKFRKKAHQKQLNIEEILQSTHTADKHANDPDIDDYDVSGILE